MTETILVHLNDLQDNPYQPRVVDDPEHIKNLALSIAADGLLQVPTARKMADGHYQLAFGHSRRKAFEWLVENVKDDAGQYALMPINVEELTDEQMYRQAISENVQRKDLDAIEVARAMRRYMDDFHANSRQTGELFGMSDATVRGKVRLLDLPEEIVTKVSAGAISEGAARIFLSTQRLANAKDMLEAFDYAVENPDEGNVDHVVRTRIINLDHVVEMWNDESGKKAMSRLYGNGWALDMKKFPNDLMDGLTYKDVNEALRVEEVPHLKALEKQFSSYYDLLAKLKEINDPEAARIEWLENPGPCSACPFYTKIDGNHYCGMKTCHDRKMTAWKKHAFIQASKTLGVPIYQSSDGEYRLLDTSTEEGLWENKNKDIRLLPKNAYQGNHYQWCSGFSNDLGWVVLTGETLKKRKQAKKEKNTTALEETLSADDRIENIINRAEHRLKWESARVVAQMLFRDWSAAQIMALKNSTSWRNFSAPQEFTFSSDAEEAGIRIALNILDGVETKMEVDSDYDLSAIEHVAQIYDHLTLVINAIGAKMPRALIKLVEAFDFEIAAVAAETKKEKKKK